MSLPIQLPLLSGVLWRELSRANVTSKYNEPLAVGKVLGVAFTGRGGCLSISAEVLLRITKDERSDAKIARRISTDCVRQFRQQMGEATESDIGFAFWGRLKGPGGSRKFRVFFNLDGEYLFVLCPTGVPLAWREKLLKVMQLLCMRAYQWSEPPFAACIKVATPALVCQPTVSEAGILLAAMASDVVDLIAAVAYATSPSGAESIRAALERGWHKGMSKVKARQAARERMITETC